MEIKNTTRKKTPLLPFDEIKQSILGKKYQLSLVFIGDKLSRKLNKQYRKIDKATNILTYPLSPDEGEILIDLNLVKKQSAQFGRPYNRFIGFLFIHGLLHLKGYEHSSKMEEAEERIERKFNL